MFSILSGPHSNFFKSRLDRFVALLTEPFKFEIGPIYGVNLSIVSLNNHAEN